MFRLSLPRIATLFILVVGCAPAPPIKATWEYWELAKEDDGQVKEIGKKHSLQSGGDEMYEVKGKQLEVVTVNSKKAKFRLGGRDSLEKQEVELPPKESQELWSDDVGVRVRVEKIAPLSD